MTLWNNPYASWDPNDSFFILWIDDEPERVVKLDAIFSYPTVIFAHGEQQVNYYLNSSKAKLDRKRCLIILDHDMPLLNGREVIEKFLFERNIPVVLCSNNAPARKNQAMILEDYAVPYCEVPITDMAFGEKIAWIIQNNSFPG